MKVAQEFQDFYRAEFRSLWGLAYVLVRDWGEAEELAQDAMVRTYHAWERIHDRDRPHLYARSVLLNLHRSVFRKAARARRFAPKLTAEVVYAEPDGGDRRDVLEALAKCSARQRQVLALRFFEDLPEADIARILGCPTGTVKSLLHRGLKRMREQMGADDELTPAGGEVR